MSGSSLPMADRRSQEPRGRWETRCDFGFGMGFQKTLVCDRQDGHKGLHSGRVIQWDGNGEITVIGYGRR